jgi:nucleoside-diphosphate-sugar epimerase
MRSVEEVEELLSRPNPADVAMFARLEGDLMVIGASGKMGPTLVRRALRASGAGKRRIIAVSRSGGYPDGVEHIAADLLDPAQVRALPFVENVVYLVGRKFGSTGNEPLTWATNAIVPAWVGERFGGARMVALSTGNVYPFVAVDSGGATEETATAPVGEYAQSALARERVIQYFSQTNGLRAALIRLNYAVEPRYGVLVDLARKVLAREPVDLTMGYVNVIWQGDANSVCLRALEICESPARILNLTGGETLAVRDLASRIGAAAGVEPLFSGSESPNALLSNASECVRLFGEPVIGVDEAIQHVVSWLQGGGETLGKPTHFEVRSGKF